MNYYKVLGRGRISSNGGKGKWPEAGQWLEVEGPLVPCENGLHFCRAKDLLGWLNEEIWEAEPAPRTETIVCDNKVVVRKARLVRQIKKWNEKAARLFAADCAEHVLPLFEKRYPCDNRPRLVIEAAGNYACREISKKELAAAWAAAWAAADAAWAAAWAAARDAAWAAAAAARAAAAAAARAAAWAAAWAAAAAADAARAAAGDAAGDAERKWQTKRLFEYMGAPAPEKEE